MNERIATGRCQSWCTDHANGTPSHQPPAPEDQLCRTRLRGAYGELVTTYSPVEGTSIHTWNACDELTPADAEQLAYALLSAVASARTAVAA
ncbi:hypothetical protein [Streptosporangium sp. NPDC020145]|uniref:hypothetical protein n=1 Tax=Streptosporangium sp. NPDC020145 TaxID=3154694 RepID=UPI003423F7AC